MPFKNASQRTTEIAQKMPAVGDLNCIRGAAADALGVGAGTVAGDDFHTGVVLQPVRNCPRLAIGQHIDGAVAFQIDNESAVAPAAAPRPVVDADNAWRRSCRHGSRPDQAQQRVPADRHGKPGCEAGTSLTPSAESNAPLGLGETDGTPNPRQGHR